MRESVESLRLQLEAAEKARDALAAERKNWHEPTCSVAYPHNASPGVSRQCNCGAHYREARDALAAALVPFANHGPAFDGDRVDQARKVLDAYAPGWRGK